MRWYALGWLWLIRGLVGVGYFMRHFIFHFIYYKDVSHFVPELHQFYKLSNCHHPIYGQPDMVSEVIIWILMFMIKTHTVSHNWPILAVCFQVFSDWVKIKSLMFSIFVFSQEYYLVMMECNTLYVILSSNRIEGFIR